MERLFKVVKSTESTKGGFVNTLEAESKIKIFGVEKTTKHRLLFKTDTEPALGTEQLINLVHYNVVPRTSTLENGVVITSQWLHEKVEG